MSVVHYDFEELGNVVACLAPSSRETKTIWAYAEALATVSRANAAAYTHSYSDDAHASSVDELTAEAHHIMGRPGGADIHGARGVVQMLAYNCTAQDGTDFLAKTDGAQDAMIDIMGALMRRL